LTTEPQLSKDVKFIDVDYNALMESKRDIVLNTPDLCDLFTQRQPPEGKNGILFHSDQYSILGCDLKNLKRLKDLIRSVVDVKNCLVLCVAEVSITYMATIDADEVIASCTTLSPGKAAPMARFD
jgi:tRNA wybutosine-synthesizing protein 4